MRPVLKTQSIASARSAMTEADWSATSSIEPCPVCGAAEGCRRHTQQAFVSCLRTVSEWPLTTGAWLHRLMSTEASLAPRAATDHTSGLIPLVRVPGFA